MWLLKKRNNRYNYAFTLVETLIAVSLVVTGIAGPIMISSLSLSSSQYASEEMTAYFLAQEALEYIRNMRDAYALDGRWMPVEKDALLGKKLKIDVFSDVLSSDAISDCGIACPLLQMDDQGSSPSYRYGYNIGWSDTVFRREILIQKSPASLDYEFIATSTVSWKSKEDERKIELREYLTKWGTQ